ncbi:MAG: putative signal transducing protein [bacterium]
MKKEDDFLTIWITDYPKALILKGKLESEGIPVLLRYESLGWTVGGITVDGLGEVEIRVPESYAQKARRILEEINIR